ncbi:DUF2914 domain-containing protein [Halomonas sp. TRM85114]|uniref:DUF5924 family protein n=1 Tax=Halomonas jincaotanensis TaxID=2810616 RepID=UPI001BD27617|nr:DUF5924 family protein [Halomonas jincaotanensis]MBS9405142.1 DUF2914 domain-containing protein [Halomonas jincaotanensis]
MNSPAPTASTLHSGLSSRLTRLQVRIEQWVTFLRPWRWLWPPMAFAAGLGSFFLVERQQWLGAMLAIGMMVAWLLLLSESLIGRMLSRRGHATLPKGVTTFIAQMIHQETLFFCLPFLLVTTVWSSGQALFTLLLLGMAVFSIIDPLYYKLAERARWLYFAFHAQCVFLVVLVTLPIMFHLTTGTSLKLALAAMVVFSLPSLLHLLSGSTLKRWVIMLALLPLLAGAGWQGRIWVPPATLWITATALSPGFDVPARQPRESVRLTPSALPATGLYAYTSIRAPRGLKEQIFHVWRHDGEIIDRIPLEIKGGRDEGYRAWSHKQNFPEAPAGTWRVDVMTDSGQRIGVLRFRVDADEAKATLADGGIDSPLGLAGIALHKLLPGRETVATSPVETAPPDQQSEQRSNDKPAAESENE